jgi:hypothetical protein
MSFGRPSSTHKFAIVEPFTATIQSKSCAVVLQWAGLGSVAMQTAEQFANQAYLVTFPETQEHPSVFETSSS